MIPAAMIYCLPVLGQIARGKLLFSGDLRPAPALVPLRGELPPGDDLNLSFHTARQPPCFVFWSPGMFLRFPALTCHLRAPRIPRVCGKLCCKGELYSSWTDPCTVVLSTSMW